MKTTRKSRVPISEQIKLINECRQSGMTDADWCREHQIAPSTFYNWVSRCRKAAADQVQQPHYGHREKPCPRQDVVPVDIISDHCSDQTVTHCLPKADMHLDNSHTIEVTMKDMTIRISNEADPVLLTRTLHLLREILC